MLVCGKLKFKIYINCTANINSVLIGTQTHTDTGKQTHTHMHTYIQYKGLEKVSKSCKTQVGEDTFLSYYFLASKQKDRKCVFRFITISKRFSVINFLAMSENVDKHVGNGCDENYLTTFLKTTIFSNRSLNLSILWTSDCHSVHL